MPVSPEDGSAGSRGGSPSPASTHRCTGEEQTGEVAALLARALSPGDWVILDGSLGAGKTAFVRGLARGLGIDPRLVHSPTFTLVSEYPGPVPLAHVDLYRVLDTRELDELGLDDLRSRPVIVAVEWGDRLPTGTSPPGAWRVHLEVISETGRLIRIARDAHAGEPSGRGPGRGSC